MLETKQISYKIGDKMILQGVSSVFDGGKIHMILGPNGSGKSTYLKIFSGDISEYSGSISYDGVDIHKIGKAKLATMRAVMSQQSPISFPISVREVLMMGRYPHFDFHPSKTDNDICDEVMKKLSIVQFSDRDFLSLSGGEKQRIQFARILAQVWIKPISGNRYLFLDEPLNSLDIRYQYEFLDFIKKFTDDSTVVVAIVHDINLAIKFGDVLHFMKNGTLVSSGKPNEILTENLIDQVFDIRSEITTTSSGETLVSVK